MNKQSKAATNIMSNSNDNVSVFASKGKSVIYKMLTWQCVILNVK